MYVSVSLDNILIMGTSESEHLATLDKVLSRLDKARFQHKWHKCVLKLPSVEYLGQKITVKSTTNWRKGTSSQGSPTTQQSLTTLVLVNYVSIMATLGKYISSSV